MNKGLIPRCDPRLRAQPVPPAGLRIPAQPRQLTARAVAGAWEAATLEAEVSLGSTVSVVSVSPSQLH